mgnify:CR=1 FL=1
MILLIPTDLIFWTSHKNKKLTFDLLNGMDKKNSIERLILSRCSKYHDDGEVLKLLEDRYSVDSLQKSYMVLQSTDGGFTKAELLKSSSSRKRRKKKKESIFRSLIRPVEQKSGNNRHSKFYGKRTKNTFKQFIKQNLKLQKDTVKGLKKLLKKDPKCLDKLKDLAELPLCSKILKFEDFQEINRLWNNYAKELIGTTDSITVMTSKLSTCEFIGAFVEVTHSGCINNIGQKGIIIWESQHNIIIVVPRAGGWRSDISVTNPKYSYSELIGGLRIINKEGTRFKFRVNVDSESPTSTEEPCYIEFEIIGDRLMVRSIDRANKKFKNHAVRDIEL